MQIARKQFPSSIYLLLCLGEVQSQAGDIVAALECFRQASMIDPSHPLPYVNAGRTYQQLNQLHLAEEHLRVALTLDPTLAMTHVDLAQYYMFTGHPNVLDILENALKLAKHVSEIRDVLTAMQVCRMQLKLVDMGIYLPPKSSIISSKFHEELV